MLIMAYKQSSEKSTVQQIFDILRMVKRSDVIFSAIINTVFVQLSVKFQLHNDIKVMKVMYLKKKNDMSNRTKTIKQSYTQVY